jgi:nicotinate-nucleotide adenylyltransferase
VRAAVATVKLALFGGSFDPPHLGHLAAAEAATHAFALDRVLFAPTASQPLKPGGAAAAYPDRLAMVRLLCRSNPAFEASELDAARPGAAPNYTVDTLETLRAANPTATLFVIVGADAFLDLPRWRDPQRLLQLADWIVLSRPGFRVALPAIVGAIPLSSRVHVLGDLHNPASATEIRHRLAAGEDCTGLVPAAVLEYIRDHGLYRS